MPTKLPPRECLQYAQILELFPLALRNAIYAKAEYRSFKKGEVVYRDGDKGPFYFGCLMMGRLRASVTSREGKEYLLAMIEKGEVFGEMSVFDQMPRPVDMFAESESTVMMLHQDDFLPHLLACPPAIQAILRQNSRRMRAYVRRMELLALQGVKQRLGRHLIHMGRDFGREVDGQIIIDVHQTQTDIGLQLGVSRESVNKQIAEFIEQNLISYNGDQIILRDVKGLKQALAVKRASASRTD